MNSTGDRNPAGNRTASEQDDSHDPIAVWLENAERVGGVGSWEWTPLTNELRMSRNMRRWATESDAERRAGIRQLVELAHPDDQSTLSKHLAGCTSSNEPPDLEFRMTIANSRPRIVRMAVNGDERAAAADADWQRLRGSLLDVTLARSAEREADACLTIARTLSESRGVDGRSERLLAALAEALGQPAAALYVPHDDELLLAALWAATPADRSEIERLTVARLTKVDGLAGRAWSRATAVSASDLATKPGDVGGTVALENWRPVLAVPAVDGERVLAVIVLYSGGHLSGQLWSDRLLSTIGFALGSFFARRPAALHPPALTARELELLPLAANGLSTDEMALRLYVSRTTVKTHLQHIYKKLDVPDRVAAVAFALREGLID